MKKTIIIIITLVFIIVVLFIMKNDSNKEISQSKDNTNLTEEKYYDKFNTEEGEITVRYNNDDLMYEYYNENGEIIYSTAMQMEIDMIKNDHETLKTLQNMKEIEVENMYRESDEVLD